MPNSEVNIMVTPWELNQVYSFRDGWSNFIFLFLYLILYIFCLIFILFLILSLTHPTFQYTPLTHSEFDGYATYHFGVNGTKGLIQYDFPSPKPSERCDNMSFAFSTNKRNSVLVHVQSSMKKKPDFLTLAIVSRWKLFVEWTDCRNIMKFCGVPVFVISIEWLIDENELISYVLSFTPFFIHRYNIIIPYCH